MNIPHIYQRECSGHEQGESKIRQDKERKKERDSTHMEVQDNFPQNGKNKPICSPPPEKRRKKGSNTQLLSPYFNLSVQYRRGTHTKKRSEGSSGNTETVQKLILFLFQFIFLFSLLLHIKTRQKKQLHINTITTAQKKSPLFSVCLSVGRLSLFFSHLSFCVLFIVAWVDFINS